MDNIQKIGFAGLGIMGQPMAMNLLGSHYELSVFNRTQSKCEALKQQGAKIAGSFSELFTHCDIVIANFSDGDVLSAQISTLEGADSSFSASGLINMSTISTTNSDEFRTRLNALGLQYLEAPVAGSKGAAEQGSLVILASGRSQWLEAVSGVLQCLGQQIFYLGETHQACIVKLGLNSLLAAMMVGVNEALALVEKAGVTGEKFMEVLPLTALNSMLFQVKRAALIDNDFSPQFPLKHMCKDLGLIADLRADNSIELPVMNSVATVYKAAMQRNPENQNRDLSVIREALS